MKCIAGDKDTHWAYSVEASALGGITPAQYSTVWCGMTR